VLYAEDLPVGRTFDLGSWEVTAEEIKAFASAWDPLPFHIDEDAAAASHFGGLVASGLHTMAISVRLSAERVVKQVALVAGREIRSVRLLHPVRPGTTLTGTVTVIEQRMRDDGRGVVAWKTELTDGDGELALTLVAEIIVLQRP
jgi:acyl dehydratase